MSTNDSGQSLHHRANDRTDSVADDLDQQFRQRLCQMVDREMNGIYKRRQDAEDVVQSVFATYYRRMDDGAYAFEDTDQLWGLLRTIAKNKLNKRVARDRAAKRDVSREEVPIESQFPAPAHLRLLEMAMTTSMDGVGSPEREILEFQLLGYDIAEIIKYALDGLQSPHIEVLQMRLQGKTQNEIAAELKCSRQVVRNCLKRLQERIGRMLDV